MYIRIHYVCLLCVIYQRLVMFIKQVIAYVGAMYTYVCLWLGRPLTITAPYNYPNPPGIEVPCADTTTTTPDPPQVLSSRLAATATCPWTMSTTRCASPSPLSAPPQSMLSVRPIMRCISPISRLCTNSWCSS